MHHLLIASGIVILAAALTIYPPVWPIGFGLVGLGLARRRDRFEREAARRRAARGGWIS